MVGKTIRVLSFGFGKMTVSRRSIRDWVNYIYGACFFTYIVLVSLIKNDVSPYVSL